MVKIQLLGVEILMTYQSPFTIRYASDEMRTLWSDKALRILWRRVWTAVAEAQAEIGLVTQEQLQELKSQNILTVLVFLKIKIQRREKDMRFQSRSIKIDMSYF